MKLKDFVLSSLRLRSRKKKTAPAELDAVAVGSTSCSELEHDPNILPSLSPRNGFCAMASCENDFTETNWQGNVLYQSLVPWKSRDGKPSSDMPDCKSNNGVLSNLSLNRFSCQLSRKFKNRQGDLSGSQNVRSYSSMSEVVREENSNYHYHHYNHCSHQHHNFHHHSQGQEAATLDPNQKKIGHKCSIEKQSNGYETKDKVKSRTGFFRKSINSFKRIRKRNSRQTDSPKGSSNYSSHPHGNDSLTCTMCSRDEVDVSHETTPDAKRPAKTKKKVSKFFFKSKGNKNKALSETVDILDCDSDSSFRLERSPHETRRVMPLERSYFECTNETCSTRTFDFREGSSFRDLDFTSFESASFGSCESDLSSARFYRARSRIKTNPWLPSPQTSHSLGDPREGYHLSESMGHVVMTEEQSRGQARSLSVECRRSSDCSSYSVHGDVYSTRRSRSGNSAAQRDVRMNLNLNTSVKSRSHVSSRVIDSWGDDCRNPNRDQTALNDLNSGTSQSRPMCIISTNSEFTKLADHLEKLANNISLEYEDMMATTMESGFADNETYQELAQYSLNTTMENASIGNENEQVSVKNNAHPSLDCYSSGKTERFFKDQFDTNVEGMPVGIEIGQECVKNNNNIIMNSVSADIDNCQALKREFFAVQEDQINQQLVGNGFHGVCRTDYWKAGSCVGDTILASQTESERKVAFECTSQSEPLGDFDNSTDRNWYHHRVITDITQIQDTQIQQILNNVGLLKHQTARQQDDHSINKREHEANKQQQYCTDIFQQQQQPCTDIFQQQQQPCTYIIQQQQAGNPRHLRNQNSLELKKSNLQEPGGGYAKDQQNHNSHLRTTCPFQELQNHISHELPKNSQHELPHNNQHELPPNSQQGFSNLTALTLQLDDISAVLPLDDWDFELNLSPPQIHGQAKASDNNRKRDDRCGEENNGRAILYTTDMNSTSHKYNRAGVALATEQSRNEDFGKGKKAEGTMKTGVDSLEPLLENNVLDSNGNRSCQQIWQSGQVNTACEYGEIMTNGGSGEIMTNGGFGEIMTNCGSGEIMTNGGFGEIMTNGGFGEMWAKCGSGAVSLTGEYIDNTNHVVPSVSYSRDTSLETCKDVAPVMTETIARVCLPPCLGRANRLDNMEIGWLSLDTADVPGYRRNITAGECLDSPTENWQWEGQPRGCESLLSPGLNGVIHLAIENSQKVTVREDYPRFQMTDACVQTDFEDEDASWDGFDVLEDLENEDFDHFQDSLLLSQENTTNNCSNISPWNQQRGSHNGFIESAHCLSGNSNSTLYTETIYNEDNNPRRTNDRLPEERLYYEEICAKSTDGIFVSRDHVYPSRLSDNISGTSSLSENVCGRTPDQLGLHLSQGYAERPTTKMTCHEQETRLQLQRNSTFQLSRSNPDNNVTLLFSEIETQFHEIFKQLGSSDLRVTMETKQPLLCDLSLTKRYFPTMDYTANKTNKRLPICENLGTAKCLSLEQIYNHVSPPIVECICTNRPGLPEKYTTAFSSTPPGATSSQAPAETWPWCCPQPGSTLMKKSISFTDAPNKTARNSSWADLVQEFLANSHSIESLERRQLSLQLNVGPVEQMRPGATAGRAVGTNRNFAVAQIEEAAPDNVVRPIVVSQSGSVVNPASEIYSGTRQGVVGRTHSGFLTGHISDTGPNSFVAPIRKSPSIPLVDSVREIHSSLQQAPSRTLFPDQLDTYTNYQSFSPLKKLPHPPASSLKTLDQKVLREWVTSSGRSLGFSRNQLASFDKASTSFPPLLIDNQGITKADLTAGDHMSSRDDIVFYGSHTLSDSQQNTHNNDHTMSDSKQNTHNNDHTMSDSKQNTHNNDHTMSDSKQNTHNNDHTIAGSNHITKVSVDIGPSHLHSTSTTPQQLQQFTDMNRMSSPLIVPAPFSSSKIGQQSFMETQSSVTRQPVTSKIEWFFQSCTTPSVNCSSTRPAIESSNHPSSSNLSNLSTIDSTSPQQLSPSPLASLQTNPLPLCSTYGSSQVDIDTRGLAEKVKSLCQDKSSVFMKIRRAQQKDRLLREHRSTIQRSMHAMRKEALLQTLLELRAKLEEQSGRLSHRRSVKMAGCNPFEVL